MRNPCVKDMYKTKKGGTTIKITWFLGGLNGENAGRESCVCTPEYEKALKVWNETQQVSMIGPVK